ncbi:Stk1 family PASTA domain-containing Ser/Thr kinase [Corynebacterium guangdongense]|uniref:non-specific serine/threonine protein kinase n=1 Tax=Corynebacterium guangdongense TaxID=1783348 RepID=A0ABU1ZXU5_9CORY|nr:Stk1 family PASTA domain-containing Ser/Thr kinase [Corynebacterium guangdongense]MDR7329754.1 serine/threonine-protein kinase [Corynebacterium guangdongense]WJZ18318.1 Serine/threonine-protein kinase PK-1 [Corynebacterium guangdongense]
MTQLAVGDVLEGRYRVDHPIARGGMSTVYRCVDLRLGRTVAAKVMDSRFVGDPASRDRFRREARAMGLLPNHPNLVNVYDFSAEDDEIVYLIMELVTGGTLRELLAERGPMPPHAAASVMRAVLTGLSVAHGKRMVHRDVKPDNILINGDHRVKIADFGLVRAASGGTATSDSIIGTVAYLSPEQVSGEDITPASDVYSAGIVLFELLTGRTPFSGENDYAHAFARLNQDVPAPSSLIEGVPDLFDELVATATMRDPAERFTDAGDFLAALDDVAADLSLPPFTVPIPRNSAAHRAAAVPTDTTGIITRTHPGLTPATEVIPARGDTRVVESPPPVAVPAPEPAPRDDLPEPRPQQEMESPKPVSNRSPWRMIVWTVLVLLVTAAVAVGAWWFGSGRYGEVPQVLGMDRTAAVAAVSEAGFEPTTRIIFHDEVPADETVGTEPPEGGRALPGEPVVILISQGRPTVPEIPAGMGVEDYRALADERTLNIETGESVWSDSVPSGTVAQTSPAPGTQVAIGSTITVALSKGPQPATVPDVEGQPLDLARRQLEEAGLNVGEVSERYDDVIFGGNVVAVNPGPGTHLERGDRVDLVVSTAFRLPDLSGMKLAEAKDLLADADVSVKTATDGKATGAAFDTVLKVSPEPGTLLNPESKPEVTLTLPGLIATPDVVGMSVKDAREALADAGLRDRGVSGKDDKDSVTEQSPAAGEPARARQRVTLEHD